MDVRRVFTFDMDGVLADIGRVEIMDRQFDTYRQARPLAPPWFFAQIQEIADVYVISARSYKNATYCTQYWLQEHFSDAETVGVICNILPKDKYKLVEMLHATYHFDDHPKTVEECGDRGVLVRLVDHYKIRDDQRHLRTVYSWKEIGDLCLAPMLKVSYNAEQARLF